MLDRPSPAACPAYGCHSTASADDSSNCEPGIAHSIISLNNIRTDLRCLAEDDTLGANNKTTPPGRQQRCTFRPNTFTSVQTCEGKRPRRYNRTVGRKIDIQGVKGDRTSTPPALTTTTISVVAVPVSLVFSLMADTTASYRSCWLCGRVMLGRSQPSPSTFSPKPTASTTTSHAFTTANACVTAAAAAASGSHGTQCCPFLPVESQREAHVSLEPTIAQHN